MENLQAIGMLASLLALGAGILFVIAAFVVIGAGGTLSRLLFEQRRTNELLSHIAQHQTGSVPPIKYK